MNCHRNSRNPNEKTRKSDYNHQNHGIKHILMMAICCGLPALLLLMLPVLGVFGTGFKLSIASIIPFLCPLMMILMIPMMLKSAKGGKSCCSEENEKTDSTKD